MRISHSSPVVLHREDDQDTWSELSSDIVELILSRLPEASVCRVGSVCKRWYFITQMPTFCEFYKKNRNGNSCSTFVYRFNGMNYTFTERSDGQGGFLFRPVEERYNVPTVSCPEDGDIPSIEAAGGLHLAYTGVKQTVLRYKLSLVEKKWRTTPEMPFFVQDPVVGVVYGILEGRGHKLVIAGGLPIDDLDEDSELAVSIYDDRTNSWGLCEPLPSEFRCFASSIFMGAVVHKSRFCVYDMYSGLVAWLDLDSKRWSPVVVLRPSRKVSQLFLVSRSGTLCLVGVQEATEPNLSFTVWNVLDEFEDTMRVGEVGYISVLPSVCRGPPSIIQRWTSSSIRASSAIVGVLLFVIVQFLIHCYKASRRAVCFVKRLLNSTVTVVRKQN